MDHNGNVWVEGCVERRTGTVTFIRTLDAQLVSRTVVLPRTLCSAEQEGGARRREDDGGRLFRVPEWWARRNRLPTCAL